MVKWIYSVFDHLVRCERGWSFFSMCVFLLKCVVAAAEAILSPLLEQEELWVISHGLHSQLCKGQPVPPRASDPRADGDVCVCHWGESEHHFTVRQLLCEHTLTISWMEAALLYLICVVFITSEKQDFRKLSSWKCEELDFHRHFKPIFFFAESFSSHLTKCLIGAESFRLPEQLQHVQIPLKLQLSGSCCFHAWRCELVWNWAFHPHQPLNLPFYPGLVDKNKISWKSSAFLSVALKSETHIWYRVKYFTSCSFEDYGLQLVKRWMDWVWKVKYFIRYFKDRCHVSENRLLSEYLDGPQCDMKELMMSYQTTTRSEEWTLILFVSRGMPLLRFCPHKPLISSNLHLPV